MQVVTIYLPMWGSWLCTAWCYVATYIAVRHILIARAELAGNRNSNLMARGSMSRVQDNTQSCTESDSFYSNTLMEIRMKVRYRRSSRSGPTCWRILSYGSRPHASMCLQSSESTHFVFTDIASYRIFACTTPACRDSNNFYCRTHSGIDRPDYVLGARRLGFPIHRGCCDKSLGGVLLFCARDIQCHDFPIRRASLSQIALHLVYTQLFDLGRRMQRQRTAQMELGGRRRS